MIKQVVVNADDLGLSIGTNRGIEKAYRQGILTSASIMPAGPAFTDAIRLAKRCPGLGVGIHLSLSWGKAVSSSQEIPDLIDSQGYFYASWGKLLWKSIFHKKILIQIEKELEAQIKKVIRAGLKPDHLNSQFHVHFMQAIFPIVQRLAKKYKIKNVRLPLEPLFSLPLSVNLIKWLILQFFGAMITSQGKLPKTYPLFYGVLHTGQMNEKILEQIFTRTEAGITEILSHPGEYDLGITQFDFQLQGIDQFLRSQNRWRELQALMNPRLKMIIKKNKIKLTTFTQLSKQC